jgi:RNA polymerase sigma-70 factor (ECF subfamily)
MPAALSQALTRPARGVHAARTPARRFVSASESELHDLIMRGLAGDGGAHRRFLELLSVRFRAFFQNRMRNSDPSQAEDLVQETLLAIHLHRETYDPAQPVTAWVYAIARYKLIDHFRRTRTQGRPVPIDDVGDLFSEERADAAEPARDIAALLSHLPEKQSTAIRLVKLEQLSVREAAERTGLTESDVKISVHRGLKKLAALVAKGASP